MRVFNQRRLQKSGSTEGEVTGDEVTGFIQINDVYRKPNACWEANGHRAALWAGGRNTNRKAPQSLIWAQMIHEVRSWNLRQGGMCLLFHFIWNSAPFPFFLSSFLSIMESKRRPARAGSLLITSHCWEFTSTSIYQEERESHRHTFSSPPDFISSSL